MPYRRIFEVDKRRSGIAVQQRVQRDLFQELPDVPVLPETLLMMEQKARQSYSNLREVAHLVLGDPGAALQIFRASGERSAGLYGSPAGIEECIAGLGVRGCLEALSGQTVRFGTHKRALQENWGHARKIATYCRLMTEDFAAGVAPDEAYLVGMFHELGALPAVLGWSIAKSNPGEMAAAGLRIAEEWSLPICVREYFCELQAPGMARRWQTLIHTAHELASMPQIDSCLSAGISVQAPASA